MVCCEPGDLGGVEAAVDVHERAPFARERARLLVGESLGMREPLRDLAIVIELREVLGRGDHGERPRVAGGGLADVDELDPVARGREPLEVADRFVVRRELVVGADGEAEDRFGGGDRGLLRLQRRARRRSQAGAKPRARSARAREVLRRIGFSLRWGSGRSTGDRSSYGFLGCAVRAGGGGAGGGARDGEAPLPRTRGRHVAGARARGAVRVGYRPARSPFRSRPGHATVRAREARHDRDDHGPASEVPAVVR